MNPDVPLERFDRPSTVEDWKTVDDVVMGGRSSSHVDWVDGSDSDAESAGWLRFSGEVSLENNGGFCSTRQIEDDRGLPGLRILKPELQGDGKTYKWTIRTASSPSNSSWRMRFETEPGSRETHQLPLAEFELWRRGTRLSTEASLDPSEITSFGILISDKQEGVFRLDLHRVDGDFAAR